VAHDQALADWTEYSVGLPGSLLRREGGGQREGSFTFGPPLLPAGWRVVWRSAPYAALQDSEVVLWTRWC
jgi:hypothetical protein